MKEANFMPYEWLCHLTSFEVYNMYHHFFFLRLNQIRFIIFMIESFKVFDREISYLSTLFY